jgi:ubiquinone/menaquinone biosynthesis C-methylase UbiE
MTVPIYDSIGQSYSKFRLPDPRIVNSLLNLLRIETASVVADIGAGTGGYSRVLANQGFFIRAVEPSSVMQAQFIEHPQVQWLTGYAEGIPLPTSSVDAVISILAIHHFSDFKQGIKEMVRIAGTGPVVILTFDPRLGERLWIADYFPSVWQDAFRFFPPLADVVALIEANRQRTVHISTLPLPHDLSDLFVTAGWRRPEIYLNPEVRAGMSAFALANASEIEKGLKWLEDDLNSGRWDAKYGRIREVKEIDAGYRFLCARVTA